MTGRRMVHIFLVLLLPAAFFLNVWQSLTYSNFKTKIADLDREQVEWIEKNKRALSGIAVLSSPERIESIAEDELSMEKAERPQIVRIKLSREKLRGND